MRHLQAPICAPDNLHAAYAAARKGKRYTPEALDFAGQAETSLIRLREELLSERWQSGPPRQFNIYEPKWRQIVAPPFPDRIVHHAIVRVIEPFFERRFIHDSYACRVNKGTHAAVQRTQRFLRIAKRRWGGCYVVKADVAKYFASIRHDVAIDALARTLDDHWLFRLFERVLSGYGFDAGVGIPVGALTSQLIANVVLDQLDHRVKDEWGERFFVRYMDDIVLIVRDKADARWRLHDLGEALGDLKLKLNPKSTYFPYQRGVDFCGYCIWPTHILPRKHTMKRWRRRLSRIAASARRHRGIQGDPAAYPTALADMRAAVKSCTAYTRHCSAHRTLTAILGDCAL